MESLRLLLCEQGTPAVSVKIRLAGDRVGSAQSPTVTNMRWNSASPMASVPVRR